LERSRYRRPKVSPPKAPLRPPTGVVLLLRRRTNPEDPRSCRRGLYHCPALLPSRSPPPPPPEPTDHLVRSPPPHPTSCPQPRACLPQPRACLPPPPGRRLGQPGSRRPPLRTTRRSRHLLRFGARRPRTQRCVGWSNRSCRMPSLTSRRRAVARCMRPLRKPTRPSPKPWRVPWGPSRAGPPVGCPPARRRKAPRRVAPQIRWIRCSHHCRRRWGIAPSSPCRAPGRWLSGVA
jgi:hypothetical protein